MNTLGITPTRGTATARGLPDREKPGCNKIARANRLEIERKMKTMRRRWGKEKQKLLALTEYDDMRHLIHRPFHFIYRFNTSAYPYIRQHIKYASKLWQRIENHFT
jgi:hypothetical protein